MYEYTEWPHTYSNGFFFHYKDCRDEEEYNVSHMKDAIRVNPGDEAKNIVKTVEDLKLRGSHDVVCYCSVGYRSSDVAQKLTRFFKSDDSESRPPTCYNLEGSLFKWANERRPMVDNENQPTSFAHPYNAVFGKLLDSALRKYPT
ncbi:hypothetical protein FSP39_001941 [Pinctada imbricata]|uniref:Rhodanese domain-containing protein n=1 Tax=Pinctada imbricata TaxID=66713 RepID=A0AA88XM74_PINIB|nr:hypothetical protein FSP39_001941 [Pinctada imbricata]